jgi:hypothetical protein
LTLKIKKDYQKKKKKCKRKRTWCFQGQTWNFTFPRKNTMGKKNCEFDGCPKFAQFNFENDKDLRFCENHKLEGMQLERSAIES